MKRFLVVIPARLDSSRFPNKMIKKINGDYTLIQQVYFNAIKSKFADDVFVATDSEEISNLIKDINGKVFFSNKKHKNGTSRVSEILNFYDYDYIINLQGDEPLVYSDIIDEVIKEISNGKESVVTAYYETNDNRILNDYNSVKLVTNKSGYAMYFSRSNIPYDIKKVNYKGKIHIGIYAYTKDILLKYKEYSGSLLSNIESLEQLDFLYNEIKIKAIPIISQHDIISVNNEEDLKKVIKYYEREKTFCDG